MTERGKIVKKRTILLVFWPLSFALFLAAVYYPNLLQTCKFFALSKSVTSFLSRAMGLIPFSVAEVLFWLVLIVVLGFLLFSGIKIIKARDRKQELRKLCSYLYSAFLVLGLINFVYITVWGINYNNRVCKDIPHTVADTVTREELEELARRLIHTANFLREQVDEDHRGIMKIEGGFDTVKELAPIAFESIAESYPELGGVYGPPKGIYFSELMSRFGVLGIYFPLTGEVNINTTIPDSILPATVCHEMVHQRGFMQEDEACYLAWMVCYNSEFPAFKYSGTLYALIYVMNALSEVDPDRAEEVKLLYGDALLQDLYELADYWERNQDTRAQKVATELNDVYLKSNKQEEGSNSYYYMVKYMVESSI